MCHLCCEVVYQILLKDYDCHLSRAGSCRNYILVSPEIISNMYKKGNFTVVGNTVVFLHIYTQHTNCTAYCEGDVKEMCICVQNKYLIRGLLFL